GGDRRAQFVRNDAEEFVLGLLGAAQLFLRFLALGIQAGVVDGDAGPAGDAGGEGFVVLLERARLLVSEHEAADDLAAAGNYRDGEVALDGHALAGRAHETGRGACDVVEPQHGDAAEPEWRPRVRSLQAIDIFGPGPGQGVQREAVRVVVRA